LCAFCFTPEASAKERSDSEKSVLPAYCKARLYGTELEKKKWEGVLGRSNFVWMNHYCSGLMEIYKCEKILKENMRNACLTEKIKSMNYTLEHTSEDFPIRYMVHFTRGDVFFRTGEDHKAEQDFLKTITMKPKFIRPYTKLFDLYYENGDLERAGEIIERGLKQKPNSRSMKRRRKKLEQSAAPDNE
jgi:tetratricopeptide (TPR) repeat protein